jgi:hypothetical protein
MRRARKGQIRSQEADRNPRFRPRQVSSENL